MPGEATKALSDAERACALHPTYAKAHFRRGQARAPAKDIPAAHAMHHAAARAGRCRREELRTPPVVEPEAGAATGTAAGAPRAPPPQEPPPQEPPPPPAAPPAAAPPPGSRVRLVGLVGRADLNGALGEVLPAMKPGERVPALDDKREACCSSRATPSLPDDAEPTER